MLALVEAPPLAKSGYKVLCNKQDSVCCVRKFFHIIEQTLIFGEHKTNFNFIIGQLWLKNYLIWNKDNNLKLK